MKMIRSTSITSTSGVTLMSAIGPPPELELKAMRCSPVALVLFRTRHEADLAEAGSFHRGHGGVDDGVLGAAVGTDIDLLLGHALGIDRQLCFEASLGDRFVV